MKIHAFLAGDLGNSAAEFLYSELKIKHPKKCIQKVFKDAVMRQAAHTIFGYLGVLRPTAYAETPILGENKLSEIAYGGYTANSITDGLTNQVEKMCPIVTLMSLLHNYRSDILVIKGINSRDEITHLRNQLATIYCVVNADIEHQPEYADYMEVVKTTGLPDLHTQMKDFAV